MGTKKIRNNQGEVIKEIHTPIKEAKIKKVKRPKKKTNKYKWFIKTKIYKWFKRVLDKRIPFTDHSINYHIYHWLNGKPSTDITDDDIVRTVLKRSPKRTHSPWEEDELIAFYYDKLKAPPETLVELGENSKWTNEDVKKHFLENFTDEVIYGDNVMDPNKLNHEYKEEDFKEDIIDESSLYRPL